MDATPEAVTPVEEAQPVEAKPEAVAPAEETQPVETQPQAVEETQPVEVKPQVSAPVDEKKAERRVSPREQVGSQYRERMEDPEDTGEFHMAFENPVVKPA